MPKVSVIIPVYNVEKYLSKCLESVCNQTLPDIEIICINDASPDNSLEILKTYANRDARIKIIDFKENKGPGAARNAGIKIAQGEYIGFVDSDDFIDLDFYEKLYHKAKETNADCVKGGRNDLKENPEPYKDETNKMSFWHYFYIAIYRNQLIKENNIYFSETNLGEDLVFLNRFCIYATNFQNFPNVYYHYIKNNQGLDSEKYSEKIFTHGLNSFTTIFQDINNAYPKTLTPEEYLLAYTIRLENLLSFFWKTTDISMRKIWCQTYFKVYNACQLKEAVNKNFKYKCLLQFMIENKEDLFFDYLKDLKRFQDLVLLEIKNKIKKNSLTPPKSPKVSVIIPVYNVEKYLPRCLESVCNQTLPDIEIICINDASPDNSLEILKTYANRDARIKIIDFKENKGVAIARNTAMDQAQGEYIGFVDPDDWVDLDFYEKLYNKAKEVDSDLVIGRAKLYKNGKILNDPNFNTFKELNVFFGFFPIGLYKNTLLKKYHINFTPHRIYGEDRLLPVMANFHAKNFTALENTYYNILDRDDSATKNITTQKIEDYIETSKLVIKFLNAVDIDKIRYNATLRSFWNGTLYFFQYANSEGFNLLENFLLWITHNLKYTGILTKANLEVLNAINANIDQATLFRTIEEARRKDIIIQLRIMTSHPAKVDLHA